MYTVIRGFICHSCYKAIEPLDARKEQGICPQMNTDESVFKFPGLHQTSWVDTIIVCHRGTEANACFVVLIWTTVNVGAALAANNPSDRDEFAAEAAQN